MNTQHIQSAWWSLDLPEDWTAEEDDTCLTFESADQACALQVSATRNDERAVTEEDLRDFASEHLDAGARAVVAAFGPFTGFTYAFLADGHDQRHWWLRHGRLLLFVSLTRPEGGRGEHEPAVEQIMRTLQPTAVA